MFSNSIQAIKVSSGVIGLAQMELSELAKHLKHHNEGETIIKKGSLAENIFFLESGNATRKLTGNILDRVIVS